jgi:carbamate kinase
MSKRIVIALGGNALLRRGEPLTEETQRRNAEVAAEVLARVATKHDCVLTHGNGPQIGLLALESEAYKEVAPYGLDVLGAESQGMIGFLLQQALHTRLPGREIATLLTTVLVGTCDPAFAKPTKPIGPVYGREVAERLAVERGWRIDPDGAGFRRVVPSPEPLSILELTAIRTLADAGVLVICSGGGGVPVIRRYDGRLDAVEGVVDKDLTSALLAEKLGADELVLLTDVRHVELGWRTPEAVSLRETTVTELRGHVFEAGTMGPKVEAACRFVERTGRPAAIGALEEADAIVEGSAGTRIVP